MSKRLSYRATAVFEGVFMLTAWLDSGRAATPVRFLLTRRRPKIKSAG